MGMAAMKRMKAMKVSKVARGSLRKWVVFKGSKERTVGGLKKSDLKKNKSGKVVSKKASDAAKKRPTFKKIMNWNAAVGKARKVLGVKGFVPVGGKSKQGQALLLKTRSFYKK